ncbi:dihydroorotase [Thermotoga petrophila RKU-10]|uniref:Dihydroorotase n=1 Tax=Thermotoga petrophila (strain ATCC BAA-489 / DSM 13996 / JCM 10882 / RKU-10) TaxID=590168 RepID=D2C7X4_THEP2|nr:dihydroorotase [Thermotoga petrophila RKU-10]
MDGKITGKEFGGKNVRIYDPFRKRWIEEEIETPFPSKGLVATFPFVDLHVHVRLNGGEDYNSLEEASLVGGFFKMVVQPNTKPPIDNKEVLERHLDLSRNKAVEFLFTVSPFGSIEAEGERVVGFSTDGIEYDYHALVESMKKRKKALWFDHSQMYEVDGIFYEGTPLPFPKRPRSNEAIAITRTVLTGLEYGFERFHIQHVTTKYSVEVISFLKNLAKVSCEVTPHHLFFCYEDIKNTNFKINPPLGSPEDRKALIEAVKEDVIDVLATDHAPHHEKPDDFLTAPYGSTSIEIAFPAYYTALGDLELVVEKLTKKPLEVLGVEAHLTEDTLVFIDPKAEFIVDVKKFKSKGKNSMFDGVRLKGRVVALKLKGRWVMIDGEVIADQKEND